ncbi:MAG: hypothetical protein H7Y10_01510 [Flavobacterium sp.]|nr:hypothetical protein [Flavobacterium sp.]
MKIISKTFFLIFFLNVMLWITPQKVSAQVSINFQVFYDNLSPYGDWVYNPNYGYVWVPDVDYGFTPYSTDGYWAFTNAGWTWISDYSWGWAPFHYGRWMYDNYYGWLWIPGSEWGPGWVSWRRSEGYYGWAPIGPGISITFAYSSGYRLPNNQWTFVRDRDFGRTNINNYYVNSSVNTTIIRNSTVINNIQVDNSSRVRYNSGPNRTEVQKRTGRSIAPVVLRERRSPGQNLGKGELQIYRPRVTKNNSNGQKTAPTIVSKREDVRQVSQRNSNTQSQKGNQQARQQQDQQQNNNQQARHQQDQQRNNQQEQQNSNNQKARQQQEQQQRNNQQAKQQQEQQRNNQQNQQQRNNEQAQQQQAQQQRNNEQAKKQQEQQQNNNQQARQQQEQQNSNNEQARQQQQQQQQQQQNNNNQQQQQDKKRGPKQ